jgi:hypothetical protein
MGLGRGYVVMFGALSACSLLVDVSGLSGDAEPTNDGGLTIGDATTSSSDAPIESADGGRFDFTPHVLASVGNVPAETGTAQQQHLVFAINSQNWWVFYIDDIDTSDMKASVSTDFTQWLAAPSRVLSESMSTEGRNFAVAYANANGKDVVHSLNSHFVTAEDARDARALIAGATINYDVGTAVTALSPFNAALNPDGCNAAITPDGFVHEVSGWDNHTGGLVGRMNLFTSSIPDLGGDFDASFVASGSLPSNGSPIQNRLILPITDGILYLWPNAPTTNDTDNVEWSKSETAGPTAPQNIFSGAAATDESTNDWNACDVGGVVHFVRRTIDSGANDAFDDMTFAGSTWTAGAAMPKDPGKKDSGVVLASDGKSLIAFAIASDAANSIRASRLSGGVWSAWTTIVSSGATRSYLSASACGTSAHAGVMWTEGASAPYRIMGIDVSSMF